MGIYSTYERTCKACVFNSRFGCEVGLPGWPNLILQECPKGRGLPRFDDDDYEDENDADLD